MSQWLTEAKTNVNVSWDQTWASLVSVFTPPRGEKLDCPLLLDNTVISRCSKIWSAFAFTDCSGLTLNFLFNGEWNCQIVEGVEYLSGRRLRVKGRRMLQTNVPPPRYPTGRYRNSRASSTKTPSFFVWSCVHHAVRHSLWLVFDE